MANKPAFNTPAVKSVARAAAHVEEPKKVLTQRQGFKTNEFVVYPAHGVGQILAIEEQEIAGAKLELFVINFIKDKMTLRVPTAKIANVGMRKLSEPDLVKRALETLKGRARIKRTMWSRRAQEYEAKINSGDIVAIAEVVRDLYRSEFSPSNPTANVSSTRPRLIVCRARSRSFSTSRRPKQSRRSRGNWPRVPAAVPRRRWTPRPTATWKPMAMMLRLPTKLRNRVLANQDKQKARPRGRAFCCVLF